MKAFRGITSSVTLTAILLAGVFVSAQQGKTKAAKTEASAQPAARKTATAPDAKAGNETSDTKTKSVVTLDGASKDAAKSSMSNVKNNPLYEGKKEGENPLYEKSGSSLKSQNSSGTAAQSEPAEAKSGDRPGKSKTAKAAPTPGGSHKDVVEYKDGEDGTVHTRPAGSK